jgi:hypothetical protein
MGIRDLVTEEDKYHLHKFCGIYVLSHFIFQYGCYFIYGKMFINGYNLLPHLFLHYTSFFFHVLKSRVLNKQLSMFIWEELRYHSLVFATRAVCILVNPDNRIIYLFLTMIGADTISFLLGDQNVSTVRGNHEYNKSFMKTIYSYFFSTSQIGATIICGGFFQNNFSDALVFSTLPPIQTSAFGMTLIRKNVINKVIWQIVYSIELSLVYIIWYFENKNLLIIPLSIFCFLMRKMKISKYQLFICLALCDYLWKYITHLVDEINLQDSFEYV